LAAITKKAIYGFALPLFFSVFSFACSDESLSLDLDGVLRCRIDRRLVNRKEKPKRGLIFLEITTSIIVVVAVIAEYQLFFLHFTGTNWCYSETSSSGLGLSSQRQ